jgi:hypothetical protein
MTTVRGEILGDYAHDAADTTTSFPVKIGGVAKNHDGTDPGSVAENDRVEARFDRQGAQYVNVGNPFSYHTSAAFTSAQTITTQFIASPGAGLSLYITDLMIHSDTTMTWQLAYGSAVTAGATIFWRGRTNSNDHCIEQFRTPLKVPADQDLSINSTSTNSAFNIAGYIAP